MLCSIIGESSSHAHRVYVRGFHALIRMTLAISRVRIKQVIITSFVWIIRSECECVCIYVCVCVHVCVRCVLCVYGTEIYQFFVDFLFAFWIYYDIWKSCKYDLVPNL